MESILSLIRRLDVPSWSEDAVSLWSVLTATFYVVGKAALGLD